ncbi:MAG: NAD-dependent epimerase/dehydratase family protein [Clostridiales bacterium]|nr:NAD-dependent epimerase/dehydratase family protein [Clostridiales bacterium]
MKILITGANGFIGKNLCYALEEYDLFLFDKAQDLGQLKEYISQADFIFHLAGVNRPENAQDFYQNRDLTQIIVDYLLDLKKVVPIIFTSSIQAVLENDYGKSKRMAEEILFSYAECSGASVYIFRLPNVFGKWSRPDYNSVVATFCYNISRSLPIRVDDPEKQLHLVFVDDVVNELKKVLTGEVYCDSGFCSVPRTFDTTVGAVAEMLYSFRESRDSLVLPSFKDGFVHCLYSTYISYLDEQNLAYDLKMNFDNRGWLAEFIKSEELGQIFISRTKPGIIRGNHWHQVKVEKFLVVAGEAVISFRAPNSENIIEYRVSGNSLKVLDIPPGYVHSIKNVGSEDVITLFWAFEIFDPEKSDTKPLETQEVGR